MSGTVARRKRAPSPAPAPEPTHLLTPGPEVLARYGRSFDLFAASATAAAACGGDALVRASERHRLDRDGLMREIADQRDALAGPDADPVVREAALTAALAWADLRWCAGRDAAGRGDMSIAQADYALRRRDSLHRRHLQALKTLAAVKRLMRPGPLAAVQINVDARRSPDAGQTRAPARDITPEPKGTL